jgi:hypothetical protein
MTDEITDDELARLPTLPVRRRKAAKPGATVDDYRTIGTLVGKALEPLQRRIADLEARPIGLHYMGTWTKGQSYAKDTGVSHRGSLWVAIKDNPEREPGTPNSGFQLCCKRGRDGKDGGAAR